MMTRYLKRGLIVILFLLALKHFESESKRITVIMLANCIEGAFLSSYTTGNKFLISMMHAEKENEDLLFCSLLIPKQHTLDAPPQHTI